MKDSEVGQIEEIEIETIYYDLIGEVEAYGLELGENPIETLTNHFTSLSRTNRSSLDMSLRIYSRTSTSEDRVIKTKAFFLSPSGKPSHNRIFVKELLQDVSLA